MMTILHSCWAEDPQGGSIVTEVGWKSWWNHMAVSPKTWNLACNKRNSIPVIVKTDLETVFVSYLVQELCSKHSSNSDSNHISCKSFEHNFCDMKFLTSKSPIATTHLWLSHFLWYLLFKTWNFQLAANHSSHCLRLSECIWLYN
jgi:hypothetical protein